ncbi:type VI secretion system Vgr family protein [Thiosocius teredinicola]|uniref:type VI secretion system Vgr family protein n=1 Tax=Thiosocius teredinicola TaxID=1973002 RepID=UPI00099106C1
MDRSFFPDLLSQQNRLIEIATALPEAALLVERFHGREAVFENFVFEIDCVSTSANLELKTLIGEEVTLYLLQADDSKRAWHGYVTEAMQLGADGGLARYRLRIEPWLRFLSYRHNSLVFQDVDIRGICERIFADYPQADWQWDVSQQLRMRSLCVQYRETDLDFVRRLLAEEGLSFRFEHDQQAQAGDEITHARHKLIVFDREAELPDNAQPDIRFHRADAPEVSDSIQLFSETRRVLPNVAIQSSWNYKELVATDAEAGSALENGDLPVLEVYDGSGAYQFESTDAAQLRTDLLLAAHEAGYRRFEGGGSVRQLNEGTVFALSQHEDYVGDDAQFVVLAVEHEGANNLGTQAAKLIEAASIEAGTYRNRFHVQPTGVPIVPLPRSKPSIRPQTALVVGLPDAPLTTERDHRIKVQFAWQRGERPNAGGLTEGIPAETQGNAPGNDQAGTWVRVAEWLAGPNWGSHNLPRLGTEVLVDFVEGDIDRPLVSRQLYNGADMPPFSAGVDASANHPGVLSGWMSHNHNDGFNQWVADDAPDQLRTRFASSYADSQLGLGHLIHQDPRSAQRGAWRGAGFELRSDAWVAVRAGEGLLISATARPQSVSTQMDVAETVGQLRAAEKTAEALSDAAVAQGAKPLASNPDQTTFIDSLDPSKGGKYEGGIGGQAAKKAKPGSRDLGDPTERFEAPFIVSEAPGDIGLSSPASTVLFAGQHIHATVQQDLHTAAAHTFSSAVGQGASWFSHTGGIKTIAAAGEVSLQAHTDELEVLADKSVTVTSSSDEIHILAKDSIVLKAGHSSITIKGGDVTFACPGQFSVKGNWNAFIGPGSRPAVRPPLPSGLEDLQNWIEVSYHEADLKPIAGAKYILTFKDGSVRRGILNDQGMVHLDDVPAGVGKVELVDARKYDPSSASGAQASANKNDWITALKAAASGTASEIS